MKQHLPTAIVGAVLCAFLASPAYAVDFEYFKSQSCGELAKELDVLQKAEKETNANIQSAKTKGNVQAVVTTLLVGWPFWGPQDHGNNNNVLAEIRADMKMVTKAQKSNKCSA